MASSDELSELGYTDLDLLGRGGFGAVYSAYDGAVGRTVAIKLIDTELDEDAQRRFERERRALAALPPHPNIITMYAISRTGSGRPFFVMELAEGGSLRRQTGHLAWPEAFTIGVQLAGALETAHRAGVIHRDVKPENVLLGRYGDAKLGDFGIATLASGGATTTAAVTATLSHAAPEILSGDPAGPASDVYSLASTIFTLIVGAPPFSGGPGGMPALIARIANQPAPSLVEHGIPEGAAAVIASALSKRPTDRPATAERFGRDLAHQVGTTGAAIPVMALATSNARPPSDVDQDEPSLLTQNATVQGRRAAPATAAAPVAVPKHHGRWIAVAGLIAVVLLAGSALAVAQPWARTADADRATSSAPPELTAPPSTSPSPSTIGVPVGSSPTPSGGPTPATASGTPSAAPRTPTPTASGRSTPPAPRANQAPTLQAIPTQTTNELASATLRLVGRDPDGNPLTYSVSGRLPLGLSLNKATGVISGRVSASAASVTTRYQAVKTTTVRLTVRVTDGKLSSQRTFSWVIRDVALVMPNYFNAYGCGSTCSASSTDAGKPDISWIGPHATTCTNTKPSGINDTGKIYSQTVAAGRNIPWGTKVVYGYYPCPS